MTAHNQFSAIAREAQSYALRGWHVFPVPQGTKKSHKNAANSDGREWGATTDAAEIVRDWNRWPNANVGIVTGPKSGFFVVEADTLDGHGVDGVANLRALIAAHGDLPDTIQAESPSGSWHIYFRYPEKATVKNSTSEVAPGIDVRGDGGMVLAPPSVKPNVTKTYSWINPPGLFELGDCPEWLLRLCLKLKLSEQAAPFRFDAGQTFAADLTAGASEVAEIVSYINPDCSYSDWLAVLMGLHSHFSGDSIGLSIADQWSARGGKYKPGEVGAKWAGFQHSGGTGWGTVCTLARQSGADLSEIARRHRGKKGLQLTRPNHLSPNTLNAFDADTGREKNTKRPRWCVDVACTIMETDPLWAGVLAHDEFVGLNLLLAPIPGTTTKRSTFTPRPLTDNDVTAAVRWFNRNGFADATKNSTADAMLLVASQAIISPVKHYLESLTWDGTQRAAQWLTRYCGAEPTDLTGKVGKAWLVSAVARALRPGCKADCALVLEGRQGAGKSSILRGLAGDDWFHDGLRDMHGKDASAALRGKWIIELPELSAMRRSDTEAVKAFLSRTEERYRPAYGRAEVVEPRRCVFAGTTNRSDYLTDDTGGRRFWPVVVGDVNLDALICDRDQIWAEAVALFRAGERWWLDRTDETAAAAVVSTRAADDPWTADVLRVVDGLTEVCGREVFQLLDVSFERRTKADEMRITGILTRAGWMRSGRYSSGTNRSATRYIPPARSV